jgi:hypothetical protein
MHYQVTARQSPVLRLVSNGKSGIVADKCHEIAGSKPILSFTAFRCAHMTE